MVLNHFNELSEQILRLEYKLVNCSDLKKFHLYMETLAIKYTLMNQYKGKKVLQSKMNNDGKENIA